MKPQRRRSPLARFLFGQVNEELLQKHRQGVAEKLAQFNSNNLL